MKTKLFAALLALVSVCQLGCSVPKGRESFANYLIAIEFVDQQGKNISDLAGDTATAKVFYSDDISKPLFPSVYSLRRDDGIMYFTIRTNDFDYDGYRPALTWLIKCKKVFGDDQIRTIESNWEASEKCTSFTFEGKTYYPEKRNGLNSARVVINR